MRDGRLTDQMVQAARSGKQNIVEGASQRSSLSGYIKLLSVARASLEELLEDYLDFGRQRGYEIWSKNDQRVLMVLRVPRGRRKPAFKLFGRPDKKDYFLNGEADRFPREFKFEGYHLEQLRW